MYWQPLMAKVQPTRSLPNHENERKWSVNDFWLYMMVIQSARWPRMAIYVVLTHFID